MTPVIKSFFTDMGMEITNEAIQIFGGYGFTKTRVLNNYIEIIVLPQYMKEQILSKLLI